MRFAPFTVTEQTDLHRDMPFPARSVVVDNYTASYLSVPGTSRIVPPFQWGVVMNLQVATTAADAVWRTPTNLIAPTAGKGQATVIFADEQQQPSNGQSVVVPSQQVVIFGPVTITGTGSIVTVASAVTVPAGCNALFLSYNESDIQNIVHIGVTGHQSGDQYIASDTPREANPAAGIFSPAADQSVDIQMTVTNGQTVRSVQLLAAFSQSAVAVQPSGQALAVIGTITGAGSSSVIFAQPNDAAVTDGYGADGTVSTTPALLQAADASREGFAVQNFGPGNLRVRFDGTNPDATHGFRVPPGCVLVRTRPDMTGAAINGVAEAGTCTVNVIVWDSH